MKDKFNLGTDLYIHGRIGWRGLSKDEYLEKSDYRIINATALMDGYVDWNNCGFISKERYEESSEIQLEEGDILISKDGSLGKIGYVKNMVGKCTVASGIFVLRNTIPDKLDFDYLYHILKSHIFKDFIRRNKAQGSTISHLYQRDLENFEIELPNIIEQRKVARILNCLDKKIEINNKINDNLYQST
ncbi:MAG TPA: restriction endonuclease subunit S, partial [Eubacterium sp.]|nr:restriction endonuclease subunit S [Eubacterium sp.]